MGGLGCVVCHAARRSGLARGLPSEIPKSLFSDFAVGTGLPGLPSQPLVRHGNNCKRQGHNWMIDHHVHSRVERDAGHDAALTWALRENFCSLAQEARAPEEAE